MNLPEQFAVFLRAEYDGSRTGFPVIIGDSSDHLDTRPPVGKP
jgi:hypothetical protein